MNDYLTDEEKAEGGRRAEAITHNEYWFIERELRQQLCQQDYSITPEDDAAFIAFWSPQRILALLRELEDLKAEFFNGMAERFRQSDERAHRQAFIIAVAKEALRTIAETEEDK